MLASGVVDAIRDNLAARACLRGPTHETAVRVGMAEGKLYIHLRPGRFVEIAAGGPVNDVPAWRVVDSCPVKFVWPRLALPLADPVSGGEIAGLRSFVNVDADGFVLAVCWILQAMQVEGPYCHLSISGSQGSGKTVLQRVVKRLLDPSVAATRALARDERDLLIAALNAHVLTADNVSAIGDERSDMLCRLATGGGLSTRRLHSNDEESVIAARRPMVFTSIGDIMRRGDLADRCIIVQAEQLPPGKRLAETEFWEAFDREEAAIRGALYDALGLALATSRETPPPAIRMADAGKWMVAGAAAFGWPASRINRLLGENRHLANLTVVESSSFALELVEFLKTRPEWRGTHAELLDALSAQAPDRVKRSHAWPNNPNGVRSQLQRLKAALEGEGVRFDVGKTNGRRWLRFAVIATDHNESSP
jgi:hypothetical protein